jgi:hypothetical protein
MSEARVSVTMSKLREPQAHLRHPRSSKTNVTFFTPKNKKGHFSKSVNAFNEKLFGLIGGGGGGFQ